MQQENTAKRKMNPTWLRAGISLALLALLFRLVPWQEMWSHARQLTLPVCLGAVACVFIAILICVIKWNFLLRSLEINVPWRDAWRMYWIGYFFNQFAPGGLGADGYRVLEMKRRYNAGKPALYSIVMERALAILSLGLWGLLGYWLGEASIPGYVALMLAVLLVGAVLLALLLAADIPPQQHKGRLAKVWIWLEEFSAYGQRAKRNPGCLACCFAYTAAFHLANLLLNHLLLSALLPQVAFVDAWVLTVGVSVISMLPISINGLGVREFAYVWIGGALAFDRGPLVAASLLFAFFVAITTLYGGVLLLKQEGAKQG